MDTDECIVIDTGPLGKMILNSSMPGSVICPSVQQYIASIALKLESGVANL